MFWPRWDLSDGSEIIFFLYQEKSSYISKVSSHLDQILLALSLKPAVLAAQQYSVNNLAFLL